jgi:hypothetical protein
VSVAEVEVNLDGTVLDGQTRACLKLWAAVLNAGMIDASSSQRARHTLYESEPLRWLYAKPDDLYYTGPHGSMKARDLPGSFIWLCDLMGFDADRARDLAWIAFAKKEDELNAKSIKAKAWASLAQETPAVPLEELICECGLPRDVCRDQCSGIPRGTSTTHGAAG